MIRPIGKGGMATVFLAEQNVLERSVALKVMSRTLAEDPAFGQRFMREAKIVSQLVHTNIVTVHEVGLHEGYYYLSMEYIDGQDLRRVRKSLSFLQKIRAIEDIARALNYAGEKGYVHRDIKPENIMFRGGDGSAVLTDFGIAKAVKTDLAMTQTGTAIGTPHYMSPEQAKGKAVDHRSDLYSLGIVFYQLLIGRVPYDAETAVAIGIKHIADPLPELPSMLQPLQVILDGLLAKDPNQRYQSGEALLNDLQALDSKVIQSKLDDVDRFDTLNTEAATALRELDTEGTEDRFTIEYQVTEELQSSPGSFLPGFLAAVFVVCVVLLVIYIFRPPVLIPYIDESEALVIQYYEQLGAALKK